MPCRYRRRGACRATSPASIFSSPTSTRLARSSAPTPWPVRPEDLARSILDRGPGAFVLTLGERGVLAAQPGGDITTLPAVAADVVDVTGAGDALIAGTLSKVIDGAPLVEALRTGLVAAALAIETGGSVRLDLSPGLIRTAARRAQAVSDPEEAQ